MNCFARAARLVRNNLTFGYCQQHNEKRKRRKKKKRKREKKEGKIKQLVAGSRWSVGSRE